MTTNSEPLLSVRGLRVSFPVTGGVLRRRIGEIRAVDGVDFDLIDGEVLGLVGESGSGKTTVGRAIMNLLRFLDPGVRLEGSIRLRTPDGPVEINGIGRRAMRPLRSQIAMIFQDPYSALNPRMTVRQILDGPLALHTDLDRGARGRRCDELLERVGLQSSDAGRYPHEFSGGQRQRIGIARALATRPRLIIADEPVSALDVSVQAQVINLMRELQDEFGLAYLFVAHDLSVVHHISDRIAVLYLGEIVEIAEADALYRDPRHPYSRALLSAVPRADPTADRSGRIRLEGDIPTPLAKPSGCGFRTRCPLAVDRCATSRPRLEERDDGRRVACPEVD